MKDFDIFVNKLDLTLVTARHPHFVFSRSFSRLIASVRFIFLCFMGSLAFCLEWLLNFL